MSTSTAAAPTNDAAPIKDTVTTKDPVTDSPVDQSPSRGIRPRLVWLLTALVLLATLIVAGTKGRQWWDARELSRANDAAVAAGRQLAINFTTVDYRTVDADTKRVQDGATGDFLTSYTQNLAELKTLLVDNKSVSKVERTEAALVSGDRDSAVVIVGVVAPTSNTSVPDGEKKTYRMKLGLREVGSAWKVQSLEFVG